MGKEGESVENIVERRSLYYPAFSLYKEIAGFYDYGPVGVRIRRNIQNAWRELFVDKIGALELETANILPEEVLKASGHLAAFTDPVVRCVQCKTPYRADKLLEEYYEKKKAKSAHVKKLSQAQLQEELDKADIKCAKCGTDKYTRIESFNLMFKTGIGQGETAGYLRPETAQSIFLDFKTIFRSYGLKLPAAISQIGRAYRNEISPRQQLVRMREFSQMDTELFFDPGDEQRWLGHIDMDELLKTRIRFILAGEEEEKAYSLEELLKKGQIPNKLFALLLHLEKELLSRMGITEDRYRFRQLEKEELPHYSRGNVDLEILTHYGYIEAAGNAYRGDFDLGNHSKHSSQDLSVMNNEKKVMPHIVEATLGMDRLFFSLLDSALADDERGWQFLRLNKEMAPYSYGVFPLQKDEALILKAEGIQKRMLEKRISSYYSETASIGKRYAKADEIGVPECITVDFQTLEDDTVTVRNRDSTKQERVRIDDLV